MNEILFFVTIVCHIIGILLCFRLFKKAGLFIWIAMATILANIEATKCIDLFGMSLTLGNVFYSTIFLATDILSELYGGKEARKGVFVGFFASIIFLIATQLDLLFIPNSEDLVHESMIILFGFMPRLCIGSLLAYLISNTFDTYLYDFIKKKFPSDQMLWLRNNGSTMISQFIDSILFTMLAFVGVYSWKVVLTLSLFTYVVKFIVALLDTPFLYLAKKIYNKFSTEEQNKKHLVS